MRLAIMYCKEIMRELDKFPVYLPGTPVEIGDIITFGKGLINNRPLGSFSQVSKLSALGVMFEQQDNLSLDSLRYASKGDVAISFTANAKAASEGMGKLEINFHKEAATYLAAADFKVKKMVDISKLKPQLNSHKHEVDWGRCFIVTSVTIARKALIMQSNSQNASLILVGEVNALQTGNDLTVNADSDLKIENYKDASFIIDWSNDVTLFFDLVKYRKQILGNWKIENKDTMFLDQESDIYDLTPVKIEDLILEEVE